MSVYRIEALNNLYTFLSQHAESKQKLSQVLSDHSPSPVDAADNQTLNSESLTSEQFVQIIVKYLSDAPLEEFSDFINELSSTKYGLNNYLRFDLTPASLTSLSQEIIDRIRKTNDDIAKIEAGHNTFENTLQPIADVSEIVAALSNSVTFMAHVSTNKELRDASTEAEKAIDAFNVQQSMREDVYKSVSAYSQTNPNLQGEQQRLLEHTLREFRRNGLHLSAEDRKQIADIQTKMGEISIQFQQNLNEEKTKLLFSLEELKGLPQDNLNRLQKEDDKYVMTLKYPDVFPALKYVEVEETRRRLESAFNSRCIEENSKLMEDLVRLRAQQAALLGCKNHAAYVLDVRMAKTPEVVFDFLNNLSKKLDPLMEKDKQALLALKKQEKQTQNLPFEEKLNMWDVQYYQRLREEREFGVDQESIKQYFPLQVVTQGMLSIYEELLDLKFVEEKGAHVWHDEVVAYVVHDRASDAMIGRVYLDLHPRDGKYGHAACFGLQPSCRIFRKERKHKQGSVRQLPASAMVANFTRAIGDKPALLDHGEVETYFHEFGHAMHSICSLADHARFSGTSVERDFVEAPSQMLENWCYEPEALARMSGHWQDHSQKLPQEQVERLVKARNANSGMLDKRQLVFGLFDLTIHTMSEANTAEIYAKVLKEVAGMDASPGTNFAAGFAHLAGGYDASYYGYMWSEVYSADMFYSRFKKEGVFNPAVGQAYRQYILKPGGSLDAMDMLRNFLGRDPIMEPFLQSKGL